MSTNIASTEKKERLISAQKVMDRLSFSRTTLERLVKANEFPKPVKTSKGRKVWVESQIDLYIEKKILESSYSETDEGVENDDS